MSLDNRSGYQGYDIKLDYSNLEKKTGLLKDELSFFEKRLSKLEADAGDKKANRRFWGGLAIGLIPTLVQLIATVINYFK